MRHSPMKFSNFKFKRLMARATVQTKNLPLASLVFVRGSDGTGFGCTPRHKKTNSSTKPSLLLALSMSSPFDVNRRNTFTNSSPQKKQMVPEPVTLEADPNQIIKAHLPFNTPQAKTIREHMHTHVKCPQEGTRVFVFRQQSGWTTVALNSTAQNPSLTMEPALVLKLAHAKFNECGAVSEVHMRMADGKSFTYDEIDSIAWTPLPAASDGESAAGSTSKTDAEIIIDNLEALQAKVEASASKIEVMEVKLGAMFDMLEKSLSKKK